MRTEGGSAVEPKAESILPNFNRWRMRCATCNEPVTIAESEDVSVFTVRPDRNMVNDMIYVVYCSNHFREAISDHTKNPLVEKSGQARP